MKGKAFRGEAGEVVGGFLSLGTWFTAIPVAGATILLAVLAGFLQQRLNLSAVVTVPAFLALLAPITGLFAMASRAGGSEAGFFEALAGAGGRGVGGFTLRHGLMTVAWSVPAVLAVQHAQGLIMSGVLSGGGGRLAGAATVGVALIAAMMILPSLTLLIATRTDTVAEAFSAGAWRWLLVERRSDLVPFLAASVGGMMIFMAAAIPPLALLVPVAADIAPELGPIMLMALPALPCATAPILAGRLAGAFVASEEIPPEPSRSTVASPSSPAIAGAPPASPDPALNRTAAGLAGIRPGPNSTSTPTGAEARVRASETVPLGVAIARAHQTSQTDPAAALAALEALRAANPRNPAVMAELARVLRLAQREDEAREAAAGAIRLALATGAGPIAYDVFRSFAHDAVHLNLEPATYEQLARILAARREHEGAAWCYRAAAALGGDPVAMQKGMLALAESALTSGDAARAAALYQAFLETWPDSRMASFASDAMEVARRKAQAPAS